VGGTWRLFAEVMDRRSGELSGAGGHATVGAGPGCEWEFGWSGLRWTRASEGAEDVAFHVGGLEVVLSNHPGMVVCRVLEKKYSKEVVYLLRLIPNGDGTRPTFRTPW